jgi:hypothetical protein
MNKWTLLAVVAGGAYLLHKAAQTHPAVAPVNTVQPLPAGAAFTGDIKRTMNNRAPDFNGEANGYGVHDWAETKLADGSVTWLMIS